MFLLQIIFFFVYLAKGVKSIKIFMMIFNEKKKVNVTNNKDTKKNNKVNPPPKNNSKSKQTKKNKKNVRLKKKIKNKFNKNRLKKKDYILNESNSKKNIVQKNNFDLENILNQGINPNLLNMQSISNDKNESNGKLIISHNFAPTINIQTPNFNINTKKLTKENNLINSSERQDFNLNNLGKALILENNSNNDKIYNIKSNIKKTSKMKKFNSNQQKINFNNIHKMETGGAAKNDINKSKIIKKEITKLSQTDSELQDMDYEEAIIHDKRSYLRMFWAFLVDTQIILGTFCTENYLNLFVIKLSFFVCTFQISFFLNALFYTDEYISDANHNEGVLDFFTGLSKAIYSFIATLIITNLLIMLSNSKEELMKIIRGKRNYKEYIKAIKDKLRSLRNKLIAYYIIIFILGIFFLYYVSAFCAVYRNSQKYLFLGFVESFVVDTLVAIILCLILSLLRYLAIYKNIKCLYSTANVISTFL
jgi:hypothetical protein